MISSNPKVKYSSCWPASSGANAWSSWSSLVVFRKCWGGIFGTTFCVVQKSCTILDGWNTKNNGISSSTGAGFHWPIHSIMECPLPPKWFGGFASKCWFFSTGKMWKPLVDMVFVQKEGVDQCENPWIFLTRTPCGMDPNEYLSSRKQGSHDFLRAGAQILWFPVLVVWFVVDVIFHS